MKECVAHRRHDVGGPCAAKGGRMTQRYSSDCSTKSSTSKSLTRGWIPRGPTLSELDCCSKSAVAVCRRQWECDSVVQGGASQTVRRKWRRDTKSRQGSPQEGLGTSLHGVRRTRARRPGGCSTTKFEPEDLLFSSHPPTTLIGCSLLCRSFSHALIQLTFLGIRARGGIAPAILTPLRA